MLQSEQHGPEHKNCGWKLGSEGLAFLLDELLLFPLRQTALRPDSELLVAFEFASWHLPHSGQAISACPSC